MFAIRTIEFGVMEDVSHSTHELLPQRLDWERRTVEFKQIWWSALGRIGDAIGKDWLK